MFFEKIFFLHKKTGAHPLLDAPLFALMGNGELQIQKYKIPAKQKSPAPGFQE